MDVLYYNTKINDELEDSCNYIHKAICLKDVDKSKADTFVKLSSEELSHAKIIFDMYESDYSKELGKDLNTALVASIHECMSKMYADGVTKIKLLHQTYSEK